MGRREALSAAGGCWDRHCPLCHLLPSIKALPEQGWQQKEENLTCSCRSLLPILLKALGEENPCTGTGLWQGEEERRAGLDEPSLGAHEDWGSLHPVSAAPSRCGCSLSSPMMCPFSTGYRGAVPGTGSGEEERCHRTHPGTTAVPCFPIALYVWAQPHARLPSSPKFPKLVTKALLHCCMWH